ncbi:MAG TPA: ATP-binding protein [Verrucomicrobiae bacterium]|nr:ATP-binding protein [Verrucomicrobiae bacterium]
MYITRKVETELSKLLEDDKIVILLGARQVGKTTLTEPFVRERGGVSLNCDIEIDRARILAAGSLSPADAMASLGNPSLIVIDEAQNLPEVGRIVKGWYDAKVRAKIVLLGSSSLDLLDQTAEPLTGRNEKLHLTPLLFSEVIRNQSWYSPQFTAKHLQEHFSSQIMALMLQQMTFGSYPEAIKSLDKERYLLNLTSDYLLRDVLQSGLIKSPDPIRRLLLLLAQRIGSEVSINTLASDLNIARPTVENYIELLERSYVIFRVNPYSTNRAKEITKSSKIYFWDMGIRNALLKDFAVTPTRQDIGDLFENWVVIEIAKHNLMLNNGRLDVLFWRNTDKREVDIILRGTNTLKAYETKWNKANATPSTKAFTSAYGVPVEVVTKDTILPLLWEDEK